MVIDSHYHLEERLLSVAELLKKMDETGVGKIALMAVMNNLIADTKGFILAIMRFLLTHRRFREIGNRMIANFDAEGNIKVPDGIIEIYPDPDNEPIFKAVKGYPGRFLGWIFVNPRGKNDQVKEFEKWKDEPGFVGVKAHPFWHRFPPVELLPVAERVAEMGKPLLIHVGFGIDGDFNALVEKVPNLKLILAHTGFPCYSDTWREIKDNENIMVDLSARSYVDRKITRQVVDYLGAERVLFGTDGPYGHRGEDGKFDYGYIKRRIEELFPDRGVQKMILGENLIRFAEL
ncbi:MAG: amidohydrolase family protein [Deltaproteobacteria bacterium]|nr:amidohydrolase family protein [Deltaproteobacteria bacterium]